MDMILEGNSSHRPVVNSPVQISIDQEIEHLQERIRQLRERRNVSAPIFKLPPEILGTIFSFVVAGRLQARGSPVLSFYYFTHISRSWRSVGLNTPHLWQVIMISKIRSSWTTTMLERSKAADLIIVSDLTIPSPLKEVLTKHTSRVRELDLEILGPSSQLEFPTLFEHLQPSSLRLHSLQLSSFTWHEDHGPTFPNGLLQADVLQRLEVKRCDGPWYSIPSRALTTLKLHDIPNRPPLIEFLEFLRGLSTLQVLDMENSLPLARNVDYGLIVPVNLPNLQRLFLSSTKNRMEVTNIISTLIVPPSATLVFNMRNSEAEANPNFDELTSSFSAFFSLMGPAADPSYRDLRVMSEGSGHIHLQAYKDDGSTSMADLDVNVQLKKRPTPISPHNLAGKLVPSLPLFNLTSLTLEINSVGTLLKDTFGHLHHLQNVRVVGNGAFEFIDALTQKRGNYNTQLSDYYSVTFPALEFLWIQYTQFRESVMDNLQDCLMERYERKAELVKLKLTHCPDLYRSDVDKLRDIIVDVEWDEMPDDSLSLDRILISIDMMGLRDY